MMHHGADYTPWEGYAVTGWPVTTLLRGEVVFDDGKIVGAPGRGEFLKRDISPFAKPRLA
jgi:dihydropyrimidinase